MQKKIKEKISLVLTGIVYLLFNLRLAPNPQTPELLNTMQHTLIQMINGAVYVIGISYAIIMFFQYSGDGSKMPWANRFRIFFIVGIIVSLGYVLFDLHLIGLYKFNVTE